MHLKCRLLNVGHFVYVLVGYTKQIVLNRNKVHNNCFILSFITFKFF